MPPAIGAGRQLATKGFGRLVRLEHVTTPALPHGRWLRWAGLAAVHVGSWPALLAASTLLVTVLTFRLLAERARRRTLVELVGRSPGGTLVIQAGGQGSPAVWVQVGDGQRGGDGGGRL